MRTTVTLDADVAAAVSRVRRERRIGVSEALNELARAGLMIKRQRRSFQQRAARLALVVDVSNVAEALEQLDGPAAR
jgi:hypothetical protein